MKQSQIHNTRSKFRFIRDKKMFSEILKTMGRNIMKELFLLDQTDSLSKSNFRRYIEVKVKNFLGRDFLDFESISHIHLFEKMKKSLNNHKLLNMSSTLNKELTTKMQSLEEVQMSEEMSFEKNKNILDLSFLTNNNIPNCDFNMNLNKSSMFNNGSGNLNKNNISNKEVITIDNDEEEYINGNKGYVEIDQQFAENYNGLNSSSNSNLNEEDQLKNTIFDLIKKYVYFIFNFLETVLSKHFRTSN
jgi:hypothetical protein